MAATHPVSVPLCSTQSAILLVALPTLNLWALMWVYTAVPLHFLDNGWPLWQVGMLLTLCYAPRLLVAPAMVRLADRAHGPHTAFLS